jgi:HD-GYP domain-containing protein (c-di-GMP phosphodiesterase class II)
MEKKVRVEELTLGMFIAELDRPWLDTPFLLQGFLIESQDQITALRQYCHSVYVDPLRGISPDGQLASGSDGPTSGTLALQPRTLPFETDHIRAPNWKLVEYLDEVSVEAELAVAKEIYAESERIVGQLFEDINRLDSGDVKRVHDVMEPMVASIIRNPDALTLLARIRRKSQYVYSHALNVSIHVLAFGRHLGFPKDDLELLGIGGLLLDVGTVRIPEKLLSRRGKLSEEEYSLVKRHVDFGLEILHRAWGLEAIVLEMVSGHHEREDGSGYPGRLGGAQISVPAKMAAIADCFDALTSSRPYARTHTPYEALQMLYDWGKRTLNGALVEEFIQCLGIYPVGGLVELNSGEVGLVVAHNRVRRLKPRVLVLLDPNKHAYQTPIMLDLLASPKLPGDTPYAVSRALEDGMYGLNPQDYYL